MTVFNQAVSGTITPAGGLVKQTGKTLAGSITPVGALVRQAVKALTASITPSGLMGGKTYLKVFAASITPASYFALKAKNTWFYIGGISQGVIQNFKTQKRQL